MKPLDNTEAYALSYIYGLLKLCAQKSGGKVRFGDCDLRNAMMRPLRGFVEAIKQVGHIDDKTNRQIAEMIDHVSLRKDMTMEEMNTVVSLDLQSSWTIGRMHAFGHIEPRIHQKASQDAE